MTKKNQKSSKAASAKPEAARPALGSGAPIGLHIQTARADATRQSAAERLMGLKEKYEGHVENQPYELGDDGHPKYRLRYYLDNGDVVSGNGDTLDEQIDDLLSKLGGRE